MKKEDGMMGRGPRAQLLRQGTRSRRRASARRTQWYPIVAERWSERSHEHEESL